MLRPWALAIALFSSSACLAQLTIDQAHYARIVVTEKDEALVTLDEVVIDTLIMESNSSLQFTTPNAFLRVNHAIIKKNVEWTGKGQTRQGKGAGGTNGTNLILEVFFHELDHLTIDTRGGSGSNGENGTYGGYKLHGQNGGHGGDGGDIFLRYRCNGFKPTFIEGKKVKAKSPSIGFRYQAGSGGLGGQGATRNTIDNNGGITYTGRPGDMGDKGKDGTLSLEEM